MLILKQETNILTAIVKRDGRKTVFDEEKIIEAVKKSFQAVGDYRSYSYYQQISSDVMRVLFERSIELPTVEQVQDTVEEVLMKYGHSQVAKAYILYRAERTRIREMNTRLMQIYEEITSKDSSESDIKRENANVNGDTAMGTMLKYGSEGAKQFYDMFILNPEHSKAHKDGDIHIHDLDFLTMTTTCCQIDIMKLFKDGFSTGHGTLREPKYIGSYSALACIAIQSNQNDQHGGQSIANFDYGLAVGVAKTFMAQYLQNMTSSLELITGFETEDVLESIHSSLHESGITLRMENYREFLKAEKDRLLTLGIDDELIDICQKNSVKNATKGTDRDTYKAMVALVHNLNTMHSRAGAQVPFSSINYGMDRSHEGRMVIKNVLLALEAGLGNGETPIFPIHVFRIKEGVNYNPADPNYDLFKLACRVSAKRLFPTFAFVDAPFNLKYYKEGHPETEAAYMGCRTRVMANIHDPSNETIYGRGNLSFTSINLPRIAIKSEGDLDEFFDELDEKIDMTANQILERFEIQANKKVRNYPFLMGEGIWTGSDKLGPDDKVGEVLKNGTLSIGFIGLAECLIALTGYHHGESKEAQELGLKIIGHMRKRIDEWAAKHRLNFSLLATPAEGLSGRFVNMDRKLYGNIEGITDKEYYTNSFHVPVDFKIAAFDKINIEAPYHELTNAGHITYVEMDGDMAKNVDAFERVIRHMKESGVGYGSINHPVDRDPVCGYIGVIGDNCPKCKRSEEDIPFERIRRITGYLVGTLERFNNAKLAEVRDRIKHS